MPGVNESLTAVVGSRHVLVDEDVRAGYERDWTGRVGGAAACVVRPGSTEEVRGVVEVCRSAGVGLVPQGGNSGLVGGGVPRGGEVVLSLQRVNDISIDADVGEAIVGAGAILEHVMDAARSEGWELGVDLSSRGSCTIGGMVATNAGG